MRLLSIFFLFFTINAAAGINVDSLKTIVESDTTIQLKVDALNQLAWEFRFSEPQNSLDYAEKSLAILETLDLPYNPGKAKALNNLGCTQTLIGRFGLADSNLNVALEMYKVLANDEETGKTLGNIAINYYYQSQLKEAIKYSELALPYLKAHPKNQAKTTQNIGVFYRGLGEYDKAIAKYITALKIFKELGDTYSELATLNNIGNLYMFYNQYDKALAYHTEALDIAVEANEIEQQGNAYQGLSLALNKLDKFEESVEKATLASTIYRDLGLRKPLLISLYGLAKNYEELNRSSESFEIYDSIKDGFKDINATASYIGTINAIGMHYAAKEQFDSAIVYLEMSLKKYHFIEDPLIYKNMLISLSLAYEKMGRTEEALTLHHTYNNIKDSLYNIEVALQVAETEAKFRLEEKEKEIQRTKDQLSGSEESNQVLEQSNMVKWYFIGALIVVLLIVVFVYSKKRKQAKQASLQKDEILKNYESLEVAYNQIHLRLKEFQSQPKTSKPLPDWVNELSKRELEVLSCLAVGMTDKEISDKLFISLSTVRTHCKRIYSKLLVKNRAEAANFAREYELI